MRFRYLLFVFMALAIAQIGAIPKSKDELSRAATSWWSFISPQQPVLEAAQVDSFLVEGEPLLFVYHNRQGGFVILANESQSRPILAYGVAGSFEYPCTNPAVSDWLEMMALEIQSIRNGEYVFADADDQWSAILSGDYRLWQNNRSVSQMLQTTWNQGYPYNRLCPADPQGPGGHVLTGCTATAMAQVMRYWSWPLQGTGSHSYYHQNYGTQSVNFGQTTYNWDNMQAICDASNVDIPLLMYHCGVAVNMDYSTSGSGAYYTTNNAFTSFFGYGAYQHVLRSNYNDTNWINLMKSELDQRRPILYAGWSSDSGHAFILDGYSNNNYFHINWGWGGSSDGFFTLGSFLSYNQNNKAVIGLQPSVQHLPPQNVILNNYGIVVNFQWSAPASSTCTGYKIYREGELVHTITSSSTTTYTFENTILGESTYQIAATYASGQSLPVVVGTVTMKENMDDLFWDIPILENQGWIFGNGWGDSWDHPIAYTWPSGGAFDSSLLSPSIQCPANAGNLITKMHYRDHPSYNDAIHLEIAVICNNVTTVLWTLNTTQDWGLFNGSLLELPISQFAGQSIKVQYRAWGNPPNIAGGWYIHDVSLSLKHPIDLALISIVTPDFINNNGSITASVEVKNKGIQATGAFTVNLYRQGLQQIATIQGPPLLAGESTILQIPATISSSGAIFVYAVINYSGESYIYNNTAGYTIYAAPNTSLSKQIGQKQVLNILPDLNYYYTSMFQVLYPSSELQFQGIVQALVLKSRFLDSVSKPWTIYMSNTTASTLTAMQPVNQSQMVYQGVVTVLPGEYPIVLNLMTPFNYTGGNLLLTFYSPYDDDISSDWSRFWDYAVPANRARQIGGYSGSSIDPTNPGAGSASLYSPYINFVISGTLLSSVAGTVVSEGGTNIAIAGASISFTGPSTHQGSTNTSGFFSLSGLHYGSTYNYTVQKQGFQTLTGSIYINSFIVNLGNLVLQDVINSPYNVNGTVMQNNYFCQITWAFSDAIASRNREQRTKVTNQARAQTGFIIYRLIAGAEDNPSSWVELSSVGSSYRTYNDMQWNTLPAGDYKYAVSSWYNYSTESPAALSDIVQRFTYGEVVGVVRDLDGAPIVGAQLFVDQLAGHGPYSSQSDSLGVYQISGIYYAANYSMVCSHPQYQSSSTTFSLNANQVLEQDFNLSDTILSPQNLQVSIQDSTYVAQLSWQGASNRQWDSFAALTRESKAFNGYSVWRVPAASVSNEALWVSLGLTEDCVFVDSLWKYLSNDEYIYAVRSAYSAGQSAPCLSAPVTHLYYGSMSGYLQDAGNNPLIGVSLNLYLSTQSYTAESDSVGYFEFENVLPNVYQMTATFPGYQDYTMGQVEVLMHELVTYTLTLTEVLFPPLNLIAEIDQDDGSVQLNWDVPVPCDSKGFVGYILWRLVPGQEFYHNSWIELTTEPISDTMYVDTTISISEGDTYRYGVQAVYSYENLSPVCLSNVIVYIVGNDDDHNVAPELLNLWIYPNPSYGFVNIAIDIPKDGEVSVGVYNLRGQRITSIGNSVLSAGTHRFTWNGRDLHGVTMGSGVYIIRVLSQSGDRAIKFLYFRQ